MWFIEGQDLATAAFEPSHFSDGKSEKDSWWSLEIRNSDVRELHCQRRMAPKPPVPRIYVTDFLLILFTVGWINFSRLYLVYFPLYS